MKPGTCCEGAKCFIHYTDDGRGFLTLASNEACSDDTAEAEIAWCPWCGLGWLSPADCERVMREALE